MSTSLLYHAFAIRGYRQTALEFSEGCVVFHIAKDRNDLRCSACGSPEVAAQGHVERRYRCPPIESRPVQAVLPIPRVACRRCGLTRQITLDFADPGGATPGPSPATPWSCPGA